MQAILALGANLGDPRAQLLDAIDAVDAHPQIEVTDRSPFVESFALTEAGIDESAPRYLNCVIAVETSLNPHELLRATRNVEAEAGRTRDVRWGPRTLDIDIITYAGETIESEDLTIPHPRAHERGFVLTPWAMMQPDAQLPKHGSVSELALAHRGEVWEAL